MRSTGISGTKGLSIQHNPEFTMMEFYQAYATYQDLMTFTEEFGPAGRGNQRGLNLILSGGVYRFNPALEKDYLSGGHLDPGGGRSPVLTDPARALALAKDQGAQLQAGDGLGKALTKIFEQLVEPRLRQPTFVTGYPVEVSPLAKRSADNPELTDRFELFVCGREIANGFTELNDPLDQQDRFLEQMKAKDAGDDEAQMMDGTMSRPWSTACLPPPVKGSGSIGW